MQNLLFSLNATMPVFFVMVVGYLLGQTGFLPPAFCKAADKLCFKVTLPVMLFLDMGSVDILHDFQPRFVLFCFAATLVGILAVWAGAKRFLKDKALVGEFVQAGYRSSAAVLGVAFIQNIYGNAGMAPLMILGQRAAVQHFCRAYLNDGISLTAQHTECRAAAARGCHQSDFAGYHFWHSLCAAAVHAAPDGHQDHEQPCVPHHAAVAFVDRRIV